MIFPAGAWTASQAGVRRGTIHAAGERSYDRASDFEISNNKLNVSGKN
jgi:hypothetical protein